MGSAIRGWLTTLGCLLLVACQSPSIQIQPTPTSPPVQSPAPATATAAAPSPTSSPTPEPNIIVTAPTSGAVLTNRVRVSGRARVYEAALMVAVFDAQGSKLAEKPVTASMGGPEFGTFDTELTFAAPSQQGQGRVEAFSHSVRDGSVINRVVIPVTLQARSPGAAAPTGTATPSR